MISWCCSISGRLRCLGVKTGQSNQTRRLGRASSNTHLTVMPIVDRFHLSFSDLHITVSWRDAVVTCDITWRASLSESRLLNRLRLSEADFVFLVIWFRYGSHIQTLTTEFQASPLCMLPPGSDLLNHEMGFLSWIWRDIVDDIIAASFALSS